MILYEYKLMKDGKFNRAGRTGNTKYIENLIKYKGRKQKRRYDLAIVKGILIGEKGSYELEHKIRVF